LMCSGEEASATEVYQPPTKFAPLPPSAQDIDAMAAATGLKEEATKLQAAASAAVAKADLLGK